MKKTIMAAAMLAVSAVALSNSAFAGPPSFNCAYARLPAEVAICQSSYLGDLDRQMASEYFSFINNYRVPGYVKQQVKTEQVSWLRWRNRCGYAQSCLQGKYNERITRLVWWNTQY